MNVAPSADLGWHSAAGAGIVLLNRSTPSTNLGVLEDDTLSPHVCVYRQELSSPWAAYSKIQAAEAHFSRKDGRRSDNLTISGSVER